ncbi:MAG: RNA polymerase sigma factor [Limisphaerales bacterium]
MISASAQNDSELVGESLSGNRDAFGQIVARYQSLVCSLAYSATGNLNASEDLAQETFLTAWKQLADLREPEKLRAWLCGIARNLINNSLRKQGREPSHRAESLEEISESHSPEPLPVEQTISNEETAILWRSLEKIPEVYREPLVLFYREHQSIEIVAANLDLTEDAVKQRLSRGRKLLQEQVLAFVEGALARTNPGQAFTLAVLATLPVLTISAKAATVGAAAVKGGVAVKGATAGSIFSVLFGPALAVIVGYLGWRKGMKNAQTPRERKFVVRNAIIILIGALIFFVSFALISAQQQLYERHPVFTTMLGLATCLGWCVFISIIAWRYVRAFEKIREEERELHPESFCNKPMLWPLRGGVWEYRSRAAFLGLPLIHCRFGKFPGQKIQPAVGWIAYGEIAYGILFASGGVAVGGISFGGTSFGILSFGGIAFGLLAFGGLSFGAVAMGGAAIGWIASGGIALGWHMAMGGMALTREFLLTHHVNEMAAREFFDRYYWLNLTRPASRSLFWIICFAPIFLQILLWRWARRKMTKLVN